MKVLVTGGAGFIGSHVAEFYSTDDDVVIYDNFSRPEALGIEKKNSRYNLDYLLTRNQKIQLFEADTRDFQSLRKASESADLIVHTAGQVAVTSSLKDPRTDFEVNALGTFNVLEAARLNDSTLIFCSTNKVYGENVNKISIKEEPKRYAFNDSSYSNGIPETFSLDGTAHSPYGSSKLAADIYAQDYAHSYGLKTGVFRMSCIYGERQFGVEDQGWLAWFIIAAMTGKPITIYGDGKQVRDALFVTDLVDAFDRFHRSKIRHAVFNIGGGPQNTLSLLELLEILTETTKMTPHVTFSHWRPADQKVYISDIGKALDKLGWEPRVSPRDGVGRMINWVGKNRGLFY